MRNKTGCARSRTRGRASVCVTTTDSTDRRACGFAAPITDPPPSAITAARRGGGPGSVGYRRSGLRRRVPPARARARARRAAAGPPRLVHRTLKVYKSQCVHRREFSSIKFVIKFSAHVLLTREVRHRFDYRFGAAYTRRPAPRQRASAQASAATHGSRPQTIGWACTPGPAA